MENDNLSNHTGSRREDTVHRRSYARGDRISDGVEMLRKSRRSVEDIEKEHDDSERKVEMNDDNESKVQVSQMESANGTITERMNQDEGEWDQVLATKGKVESRKNRRVTELKRAKERE